jgi:hypothetical protein
MTWIPGRGLGLRSLGDNLPRLYNRLEQITFGFAAPNSGATLKDEYIVERLQAAEFDKPQRTTL